jgi:predicted acyltransferase (DUF342 family)
MAFQPLSTANTFTQWVTETQRSVSVLNQFTDGVTDPTNYSNTNVSVGEDLLVGEDLTVGGFLILDDIGYNDLTVAGNVEVVQSLTSSEGVFDSLVILNNVTSVNTTTINVGTDANLTTLTVDDTLSTDNIIIIGDVTGTSNLFVPNLVVTQNAESVNVTTKLFIGTDATVHGNLLAFLCCQNGLNLTGDLTANTVVIDTLTVNTLIGTANTNIYNSIFASNAFTSVQNTLAEFASLSCILG